MSATIPRVERMGNRTIVNVPAAHAEQLKSHLDNHNIRTAVLADGPDGVTRLEVIDLGADIDAVLGEWELAKG